MSIIRMLIRIERSIVNFYVFIEKISKLYKEERVHIIKFLLITDDQ